MNDVKGVALFEQWAAVEFDEWNLPVYSLVVEKYFNKFVLPSFHNYTHLTQWHRLKGLETNQAIVDAHIAKFQSKLPAFDQILGKQKYMGGDEFSLIDIFYMPYTEKLYTIGDGGLIDAHPNVKAWWERISSRESWKKANSPSA